MDSKFYSLKAKTLAGEEAGMGNFRNKNVMIVNTASNCGLTRQFEGLEKLYRKYREKDFVILGFPCNQFGNQEPGDEKSISEGCVLNFGVTFPMFSKIEVNGKNAHPLFRYLKSELKGLFGGRIKWNFTKFLIDKEGRPVKRFSPATKPEKIDQYLKRVLG